MRGWRPTRGVRRFKLRRSMSEVAPITVARAATLRRNGRHEMEDLQNFPWTMGWRPNYQSAVRC